MNTTELQSIMAQFDLFDGALLSHGYKPYMRDYELIVEIHVGPAEQGTYSYLFKYCVAVDICTSVPDDIYKDSLDDRLLQYDTGVEFGGYVWGVNWSDLNPGWKLIQDSPKANLWQTRIGIDFHEVLLKGNAYKIDLVFSELEVTKLSGQISPGTNSTFIPRR